MAAAAIALVWLGMLLGVSFLATPVKFVVQELSLPVALQVGQATFALFSRVEWLLATALLLVTALRWRSRRVVFAIALAAGAAVLFQSVWLLPALDARVGMIITGDNPPASSHHTLYTALEAAKAALLSLLAVLALRRSSSSANPAA